MLFEHFAPKVAALAKPAAELKPIQETPGVFKEGECIVTYQDGRKVMFNYAAFVFFFAAFVIQKKGKLVIPFLLKETAVA